MSECSQHSVHLVKSSTVVELQACIANALLYFCQQSKTKARPVLDGEEAVLRPI